MSYLLPLFPAESSEAALDAASARILCYHVNRTGDSQIIRVMSELGCYWEQTVFADERILFEALPESYLEIHSASASGVLVTTAECELFQISESKPN
ncbi:MAG: protein of unknown function containing DUF1830 domain [Phormidium sp. OSCR]|nr:MAG: protein of unknown function containing DUF1830 domain [Phormidium sp. OSCR]